MSPEDQDAHEIRKKRLPSKSAHFNGLSGFAALVSTVREVVAGPHVMKNPQLQPIIPTVDARIHFDFRDHSDNVNAYAENAARDV